MTIDPGFAEFLDVIWNMNADLPIDVEAWISNSLSVGNPDYVYRREVTMPLPEPPSLEE